MTANKNCHNVFVIKNDVGYIGNSVNNFRTISTIKIHAFLNGLEELLLLLIDKTKSKVKFFLLNNVKRFSMDKR